MDPSLIYTAVVCSILFLLLAKQVAYWMISILDKPAGFVRQRLIYAYLIHRHRILGPLTRGRFCFIILVISINIFFSTFRAISPERSGIRTGRMALVNLIPLYLGLHNSYIADLLGLDLSFFRFLHFLAAVMCTVSGIVHSVIEVRASQGALLKERTRLYGMIVGCPPTVRLAAN